MRQRESSRWIATLALQTWSVRIAILHAKKKIAFTSFIVCDLHHVKNEFS